MSSPDSRREQSADHGNAGQVAAKVGSISINSTRRQIDDRFPELGFDVQTNGLPYYEVLLTTERRLFDPARHAERNATNFYASRGDGPRPKLTMTVGNPARYMVQPTVLIGFAEAIKKARAADPKLKQEPAAIYYTLIAYADADGRDPVFAHDPMRLAAEAPSVFVADHFTGQSLSTVLGIPAHMLKRVCEPSADGNGTNGYGARTHALGGDDTDDLGEGEDGYSGASAFADEDEDLWNESVAYAAADDDDDDATPQDAYELNKAQAYEDEEDDSWGNYQTGSASLGAHAYGEDEDDDYSDGFEQAGPIHSMQAYTSQAQESVFPSEMGEPEDLYDGESDGAGLSSDEDEDDYDFASSLSDDAGHTPYTSDDGDDYAPASASAYAAAGYGHNGHGNGHGHGHAARAQHADAAEDDDYFSSMSYDDGYGVAEGGSARVGYAAAYGDEAELGFQALDDGSKLEAAIDAKGMSPDDIRRIKEKVRIIEHITKDESGNELYKACNRDGEFEGKFGQKHPAYQKFHVGLSYGIVQFTQDSGELGRLLALMKKKDERTFNSTFGEHAQELLDVTNATGPASKDSPGGRSRRVQPVGGRDLWADEWIKRFQKAAEHLPFQAAQIELAAKDFLDPMLPFAHALGLDTDRALTMLVDRAIQMGVGGARRWIINTVGPVKTPALLQQVLAALGQADLKSFQKSKNLKADGVLGATTHAALIEELRKKGAGASPVPVPDPKQMMEMLVREAAGKSWGGRVKRIYEAKQGFDDKPVQL